jgi:hypothetical protein
MRIKCLFFVLLFAVFGSPSCKKTSPTDQTKNPPGESQVVGGVAEPDSRYPWVVNTAGTLDCHGVLINPEWVLTAAHCVETAALRISYRRTDPFTGDVEQIKHLLGPGLMTGVFVHPQYNVPSALDHDIALIKVPAPSFVISPYLQTVGLPSSPTVAGLVGTVASTIRSGSLLPPGKVVVFRAAIPLQSFGPTFDMSTSNVTGSLCPGDSGSGFVTYENGRATVRGIASAVNASADCVMPAGNRVFFTDVFAHRDWILQTMRLTDYLVEGNTRVRWSGRPAHGVMGVGCPNPFGTMWGPLNVLGVEEGANCEAGQTESIVCSLTDPQIGPMGAAITGFSMKTECAPHAATVQSLPFTPTWASFYGVAPIHPDSPFGICRREFTCQVNRVSEVADPGNGGVLSQ